MTKVQVNSQGKVYVASGKALLAKNFGTKSITENGTYTASSDSLDGYSSVTVDVASSGGTKYGASIDNILGDVNASGVLQLPTGQVDLSFAGVQDIATTALANTFSNSTAIKTVSFPNLTQISANSVMTGCFQNCTALTSVSFPQLATISGTLTMMNTFSGCSALTSISFPKLATLSNTSVSSWVFYNTFQNCTSLTSVSFPQLATISGGGGMYGTFSGCRNITTVSFPKLTTVNANAFGTSTYNYMFYNCTGITAIHFKSTSKTAIQATSGYSTKWGATNATIYFDL